MQRRKEEPSWRLEDGESESGTRTFYTVGTCEILEAGPAGPRLCLRVTGSIDSRRCSKKSGMKKERACERSYLGFGGGSAHLGKRTNGRAY